MNVLTWVFSVPSRCGPVEGGPRSRCQWPATVVAQHCTRHDLAPALHAARRVAHSCDHAISGIDPR